MAQPRPAPPRWTALAAGLALASLLAAHLDTLASALRVLQGTGVLAVPLVTRMSRGEALEHDLRRRVLEVVRRDPGVCASAVADEVGAAWGTVLYHLDTLEDTGYVVSMKHGRHRRYFERGGTPTGAREALATLQRDTTAEVYETVREDPGLSQQEIADQVGLTPQALAWHMDRLVEVGLVEKERDGRRKLHYASNPGDDGPPLRVPA